MRTSGMGAVLAAIAVGALFTACGSNDSGDAAGGSGLKLGALLPQTGDLAFLGPSALDAAKLAVSEANAAGGVRGQDVELVARDEGDSPEIAKASADALRNDGVAVIIGAISSAQSLSVIDSVSQSGIVMISPANGGEDFTTYPDDGYYFRTHPRSSSDGRLLAELVAERGFKRVALLAQNDSYGQAYANGFAEEFERGGGQLSPRIDFDPSGQSFSAETTRVAKGDPEAVVLVAFTDTAALIARGAFRVGLLDEPWFVTDGIKDPKFPEKAFPEDPSRLTSWMGSGVGEPGGAANEAFREAYEKEYGEPAGTFAAQTYDAAWLAILAAEANGVTGVNVRDGLKDTSGPDGEQCHASECLELVRNGTEIDYVGASGDIDFDDAGEIASAHFILWKFDRDGTTKDLEVVKQEN
jgi:branched-chain amino acid transport system substrate-binding protein